MRRGEPADEAGEAHAHGTGTSPAATTARHAASALTLWLLGLGVLVAFSWAGGLIAGWLHLPIPGSTLGMLGLLIVLLTPLRQRVAAAVGPAADSLIGVLPLLLVPLAVGIVGSFGDIAAHALGIAAALVAGWLVTLVTAAFVADLLMRRTRRR